VTWFLTVFSVIHRISAIARLFALVAIKLNKELGNLFFGSCIIEIVTDRGSTEMSLKRGGLLALFALLPVLLLGKSGFAQERSTSRAPLVAEIAFQYAALDRTSAAEVLDKALSIIEVDQSDCYKSAPLIRVANGYALIGQSSKAKQLQARAFQIARAQTIANCRLSATSPEESLLNRAVEYAEAGQYNFALDIIRGVENPFRSLSMVRIAESYKKDQKPDQARQILTEAIAVAQRNPDLASRSQLLMGVAFELKRTEQSELLPVLLEQILTTIRSTPKPQSEDKIGLNLNQTIQVAELFTATGQKQRAIAILNQVLPEIQAFRPRQFPAERVNLFSRLAVQYAAAGQASQAKAILVSARTVKLSGQNFAATQIARSYAEIGQIRTARTLVSQLKSLTEHENALQAIAMYYVKSGQVEQALQIARSLKTARNLTLSEIVRYLLENQQYDQALKVAQQEKVQGILPEVAIAYAEAGKPERARRIVQSILSRSNRSTALDWLMPVLAQSFAEQGQFEQALQIAQAIRQKEYQSQALSAIAHQYIVRDRVGNRAKALALLDQALKTALSINRTNAED
jgi:tetratricopeptide (TPR) repeat protein